MSTIFKTRISQQEVQTPTLSTDTVVTDNFITSSIQSESVASENINATIVQGEEIIANDLSTENIAISNDLSVGQDVIVSSGNVLVGRKGIVSFVDDGEEVDENGASGFPIYNGVPEVLNNSTVYNIGEIDKDIDLSNIRFGGNDNMVQTCEIWFSTPADTARSVGDTYEITWPENVVWLDSTDGNAPAIVKGTEYRIVLRKENEQIVASIAYAIGEGQQNVDEMIRDAAQKDGDNTFTGVNTFTGEVDMSGAQATPPDGWNVGELTAEQVLSVVPMAWDETSVTFGEGSTNPGRNTIVGAKITGHGERNTLVGEESYSQSSYGTAMGYKARTGYNGSSVGYDAQSTGNEAVAIGVSSRANSHPSMAIGTSTAASASYSTALGYHVKTKSPKALTIGSEFNETVDGSTVTHPCTTEGAGSITIGAGANTLNTTTTVDGVETTVESSNAVTIGCKASNSGADSVVIGAAVNNKGAGNVTIGTGAQTTYGDKVIAIGSNAQSIYGGIAIGASSNTRNGAAVVIGNSASGNFDSVSLGRRTSIGSCGVAIGTEANATAINTIVIGCSATITNTGDIQSENTIVIGYGATASAPNAVALGVRARAADEGVIVFNSSTAYRSDTSYNTQLYFSGANTSLANQYYGDENGENGEAFMGYTVTDKSNNVIACGTRRLSELFTDNTLNQAATIDEETGDYVMPKVFHPSDLDLPVEEPAEEQIEPEDIVINIPEPTLPEPEEYIPLPVYPIVEPEIEEL